MRKNDAQPRETRVLPRALIDAIGQLDNAHVQLLQQILHSHPQEEWAMLNPSRFSDTEMQMYNEMRDKFTDEEQDAYDKWVLGGQPELVANKSLKEAMDELGISLPDESGDSRLPAPVRDVNLPPVTADTEKRDEPQAITDEKPRPKPVSFSPSTRVEMAMAIANRRHGKSWDALDAPHKQQVWDDAGEALRIAANGLI
jgi:hypothetical protein